MSPEAAAILSGLIGGLVSGGLATITTLWAYGHGYIKIESIERRKQKAALVDELLGNRYILTTGYDYDGAEAREFNRSITRVLYLFFDDNNVMRAYDEFANDCNNTDKLMSLLRAVVKSLGLPDELLTSHLKRTATIPNPWHEAGKSGGPGMRLR
jgi:hypothetical protein